MRTRRIALGLVLLGIFALAPEAWAQEADGLDVRACCPPPEPCCGPPDERPFVRVGKDMSLAFGGQFRVVSQFVNFDRHSLTIGDDQGTSAFAALRLRPWVNIYGSDRCSYGVYAQVEIGHIFFGEDNDFPKTFGPDPDEVGVELRRGYLWWKPCPTQRVRLGVLDWQDRFGERPTFGDPWWSVDRYDSFQAPLANSIWDFSVAGIDWEIDSAGWHWRLSALVLDEDDNTFDGDGAAWLFGLDVDREVGCSLLGASAYYLHDDGDYSYGTFGGPGAAYKSAWDLWLGARAHVPLGRLEASAFAIYNTGETENADWEHDGWAAKVALASPGPCTSWRVQALYSSGNDGSSATSSGEFRTIAQSERDNFGAQGYWSYLALSSPHGPSDVDDLGVGVQNRGLGLLAVQGMVEHKFASRISGRAAVGWMRSAESNPISGSSAMGIEVMAELSFKLGANLGLDVGGAWFFTGDFYRAAGGPEPDDLGMLWTRLQVEF